MSENQLDKFEPNNFEKNKPLDSQTPGTEQMEENLAEKNWATQKLAENKFVEQNSAQQNSAGQNSVEQNLQKQESAKGNDLPAKKERKSVFHITAIVVVVLLIVTIVVQICVMINLKRRTDEYNRRNDQLPALPEQICLLNPTNSFELIDLIHLFKSPEQTN